MAKFIIIKKHQIFKYCSIIFIFFIFFYILYLFTSEDTATFLQKDALFQNQLKADFNGDGVLDEVLIKESESNYTINVKSLGKTYTLKTKDFNENFLELSPSKVIQINTIDLSRDNLLEIIISGFKNNSSSTYIFKWINDDFEEIFRTNKNIFGILDSKNSRTPKLLHTSSSKGDIETEGYLFIGDTLKDISHSKPKILSLSVIQKFIDLIELPYEILDAPDLFSPSIASTELGILWNLDKESCNYSFQNGYFYDISWNDKGDPTSLIWILSFKKFNTSSANTSELILKVSVQINEFGDYKISSITK